MTKQVVARPSSRVAWLCRSILRTQLAWMNGHTRPKMPSESAVNSHTNPQCSDGGVGMAARSADAAARDSSRLAENDSGHVAVLAPAPGGGTCALASGGGIAPSAVAASANNSASGIHPAMPWRQPSASAASLPSLSHWRTLASLYGPYFSPFWPIHICSLLLTSNSLLVSRCTTRRQPKSRHPRKCHGGVSSAGRLVWKAASRTPARPDLWRTASRQEQPYPRILFRSPGSEISGLVAAGQAWPGATLRVRCIRTRQERPASTPLNALASPALRSMSRRQVMTGPARSCWCRRQLAPRWTMQQQRGLPRWWWPVPAPMPPLAGLRWWTPGRQLSTLRPP